MSVAQLKTNENELEEIYRKIERLERLREEVDQYREVENDSDCSFGEKITALKNLNEACEEYEFFLENEPYLSH